MKKILTILLAASLSGAMLIGMTACNNGGNSDGTSGNNSVVNPFAQFASTPDGGASSTVSQTTDVASNVTTPSQPSEVSFPTSTVSVPAESSINTQPSTVSVPVSSDPWDDDSEPWDDDSDPWDDSEPSFEISSVTPKGQVNPAYAGHYTMKIDFDKIDWSQYGITEVSGVDIQQYIEQYKSYFEMIEMEMTLNADGTASASANAMGQSSSTDDGSWTADGTTVYITLSGSTAAFVYNNGVLTGGDTPYMYFVKD